jgi:AmiR/NasT family two-component response regulator
MKRLGDNCSDLRLIRQKIQDGRTEREILHDSAYARLEARLQTLPVIEQAKGILMAQTGCTADQAFDMLRKASQRSNVRVRDLATEIVTRSANGAGGGAPQPSRGPRS